MRPKDEGGNVNESGIDISVWISRAELYTWLAESISREQTLFPRFSV